MSVIIPRNTTIPTKRSEVYTTAVDNQPGVDIEVFQGERPLVEGNKLLGNFHLGGLPPAPRGMPQIEVTFDIDANGIVHVTAKDKGTGKDASITLTGSTGLSKDEIDAKVQEAEAHKAEDEDRKKLLENKNILDQTIYQVEKLIKENGDKLPEGDQQGGRDGPGRRQGGPGQPGQGPDPEGPGEPHRQVPQAGRVHLQGDPPPAPPTGGGGPGRRRDGKKDDDVIDAEVVS